MTFGKKQYDVAIIGGGLAGLTLARQLLLAHPDMKILIAELRKHPAPEAAFKVGESTVEIGSHYLASKLGLEKYLEEAQLPKAGLRFFFSQHDNNNIADRLEFGGTDFPPVPSYQIDRGRFENDLRKMVVGQGAEFYDATRVTHVELGKSHHSLTLVHKKEQHKVKTRWVVDASGRVSLLKKQLDLQKAVSHDVNAAWFRIQEEIDINDWDSSPQWCEAVPKGLRRLSTNHLMGKGYWVWLIPLASKATSLGIVADNKIHPYQSISKFDSALQWLHQFEPQCAKIVEQHLDKRQDFHALKHFSYSAEKVFSSERWCLTGEAGVFLDPFYSPGTDFIAMSNDFIYDLITREMAGENIRRRALHHNRLYFETFNSFLKIYQSQYSLMGNAQGMLAKIVWDYAAYWTITGFLYFHNCLTDLNFMQSIIGELNVFSALNDKIQTLFREWENHVDSPKMSGFIDAFEIEFLYELNRELNESLSSDQIHERFKHNLRLIFSIAEEICEYANVPELLSDLKRQTAISTDESIKSEFSKIWMEEKVQHG